MVKIKNLTPEQVQEVMQEVHNKHKNNYEEGFDGEVKLFQMLVDAKGYAYTDGEDINNNNKNNTIGLNTLLTNLTDSGDVMNVLFHEGYNSEKHDKIKPSAMRYGDYAETVWNKQNSDNGYVNTNSISNMEWNVANVENNTIREGNDKYFKDRINTALNNGTVDYYNIKNGTVEKGDTLTSITKEMNEFYGTKLTVDNVQKINAVANKNKIKIGDVIAVGTVGEDGVWKVPYDPNVVNLDYWENLTMEQKKITHYQGNNFNMDTSNLNYEKLVNNSHDWSNKGEALAHNVGTVGNYDFRGKNEYEHQQVIANKDTGKIITTPENMGTYDYELPSITNGYKNHNIVDIDPWIVWGNTPNDGTTEQQRIQSLRNSFWGNAGFNKYIKNNQNSIYNKSKIK